LTDYISTMYTFDLWMSKCVHDLLIVVVNFLSSKWEAKHVTIKLFEVFNDCGATVVLRSQQLLNKFLLPKRSLLMLRIKALICKLVQMV